MLQWKTLRSSYKTLHGGPFNEGSPPLYVKHPLYYLIRLGETPVKVVHVPSQPQSLTGMPRWRRILNNDNNNTKYNNEDLMTSACTKQSDFFIRGGGGGEALWMVYMNYFLYGDIEKPFKTSEIWVSQSCIRQHFSCEIMKNCVSNLKEHTIYKTKSSFFGSKSVKSRLKYP